MRHPLISFATWTTVVSVVLSALALALIEERVASKREDTPRSVGMRTIALADDDARRQAKPSDLSSTARTALADPATPSSTVRAQAWASSR